MTTQGPFLFGTSGASTTNFTNDTDFSYLGGQPYTSNPDWTQVIVGFVPGTPMPGPTETLGPFSSNWIVSGTGGSGQILLFIQDLEERTL